MSPATCLCNRMCNRCHVDILCTSPASCMHHGIVLRVPCHEWHRRALQDFWRSAQTTSECVTRACRQHKPGRPHTHTHTCMSGSGSSHDWVYRNVGGNMAGRSTLFSCGGSAIGGYISVQCGSVCSRCRRRPCDEEASDAPSRSQLAQEAAPRDKNTVPSPAGE